MTCSRRSARVADLGVPSWSVTALVLACLLALAALADSSCEPNTPADVNLRIIRPTPSMPAGRSEKLIGTKPLRRASGVA